MGGSGFRAPVTSVILAAIAGGAVSAAAWRWPIADPETVEHAHEGLPAHHPHWQEGYAKGRNIHAHAFVIDDLHPSWPHAG